MPDGGPTQSGSRPVMELASNRHHLEGPASRRRQAARSGSGRDIDRPATLMTSVFELTPPDPPAVSDEPPITIRVDGTGMVVLAPRPGRLDGAATDALVAAINAAVAGGAGALIDLDRGPSTPFEESPVRQLSCGRHRGDSPAARTAGPGLIELAAGDEPWLLDVVGRRLTRSPNTHVRFLPASAWTRVRHVTVSTRAVSAVGGTGTRIAMSRTR